MKPTYESTDENDALGQAQPVLPGMVPEDEDWPESYDEPEPLGERETSALARDVKPSTERRVTRRREPAMTSAMNGLPPIKVIGIGGGGCNAVNRMIAEDVVGVQFVGIDTQDNAAAARAHEKRFGVTYPSIEDVDGRVLLGLRGSLPPKAIPSTIVLDRSGRVAARVLGQVRASTLRALIADALAERDVA